MVHYIDHLNRGLDEAGVGTQQRFLMQSNGGVMPFSAAIAGGRTVHTLFSGPAAGAQAARLSRARTTRAAGLVTLDMGGTSADIAFIEGGMPLETTEGDDRAPPDRRAGARHDLDLGRRRLDRLDRRRRLSQCRPAERRRRSGPGLLRTRRHAADRHRCRHRLRLSQPGLFPRRRADARRRGVARRAQDRMSPIRSRWTCSRPPPASSASSTCAWPTRCACSRPSAASISPPSRCCRSAAPARCMPRRSRRSSACGASWCRRGRARSRRWGCSAPTWCTTTSARSCGRSPRSAPSTPRSIFRQLEAKAREELAAEGMDGRRRAVRARARSALHRPGLRTAHAARRPVHAAADRGVAGRRARALRRAPRADPRPRRQGAPGRGGELSPARARHGAEIRAARGAAPASPRLADVAVKGKRAHPFRRRSSRSRRRSTSATASTSARPSPAPPSSSSSTPPPSSRRLERARRWHRNLIRRRCSPD